MASALLFLFVGCAGFLSSKDQWVAPEYPPPPEELGDFVVLSYGLPFVYEEGQPRQETFLHVLREFVAPANWAKGPDSMTPVAHILVVTTTADNHLRLKRFFDSLPDRPEYYKKTWTRLEGPRKDDGYYGAEAYDDPDERPDGSYDEEKPRKPAAK